MAVWRVTRERIQLFPHPNPLVERLELGRLGQYQVVVGKGIFKDGSIVIFVPEKSVLPDNIADEGDRRKYLAGSKQDRIKCHVMQKELSMGIILDDRPELADVPLGEDISERLGIVRYEAPIPDCLAGKVFSLTDTGTGIHKHEVEIFNLHPTEFQIGEQVIVTEKINGTQGVFVLLADGRRLVSSKLLVHKDLYFVDGENNAYTEAAHNTGIFDLMAKHFPGKNCQVFGEVIPSVKRYSYGRNKRTAILFRVDVEGETLTFDNVPDDFKKLWSPVLYSGPFDLNVIRPLREGQEQLSGNQLHIKEGIVITPMQPRRAAPGFRLYLKLLNPKYVPDPDDDIS